MVDTRAAVQGLLAFLRTDIQCSAKDYHHSSHTLHDDLHDSLSVVEMFREIRKEACVGSVCFDSLAYSEAGLGLRFRSDEELARIREAVQTFLQRKRLARRNAWDRLVLDED
jgi:hypothetical protein